VRHFLDNEINLTLLEKDVLLAYYDPFAAVAMATPALADGHEAKV